MGSFFTKLTDEQKAKKAEEQEKIDGMSNAYKAYNKAWDEYKQANRNNRDAPLFSTTEEGIRLNADKGAADKIYSDFKNPPPPTGGFRRRKSSKRRKSSSRSRSRSRKTPKRKN